MLLLSQIALFLDFNDLGKCLDKCNSSTMAGVIYLGIIVVLCAGVTLRDDNCTGNRGDGYTASSRTGGQRIHGDNGGGCQVCKISQSW